MTRDDIILPRAVVEQVREALEAMQSYAAAERKGLRICDEAVITITAALAEPESDAIAQAVEAEVHELRAKNSRWVQEP